jgi:hypothetical protein
LSGLSLLPIEHPRCSKCRQVRMSLARIMPGPKGFDIRTFECAKCDHVMVVSVDHDPMKSAGAGWQNSQLKPPR